MDCSVSRGIMKHISSTMSDQASTENKINTLLQDYKEEIFPLVLEHYADLPAEARQALSRMYHFFCGLHPLVHFAEIASTTLGELEKAFEDNIPCLYPSFKSRDRSATERLIRTACKSFARGTDERNGVYCRFSLAVEKYLKDNELRPLPLEPFRGNR